METLYRFHRGSMGRGITALYHVFFGCIGVPAGTVENSPARFGEFSEPCWVPLSFGTSPEGTAEVSSHAPSAGQQTLAVSCVCSLQFQVPCGRFSRP